MNYDKTIRARLNNKIETINGIDYYRGRHIIKQDTAIDGGVCLGNGKREAIVVDSQKYPKLRELYEKAKQKASVDNKVQRNRVLKAVYDVVLDAMPNQDSVKSESLIYKYHAWNDRKISLDVFINEDAGVCRHKALACGALIELFKKEGYVRGKPSIDKNSSPSGMHAWCRYTSFNGDVQILDVMKEYFGSLKDSVKNAKWNYRRPEEK